MTTHPATHPDPTTRPAAHPSAPAVGSAAYAVRPIAPSDLAQLRTADDAGRPCVPFTDDEGGSPLRCCLRRSEPGERIALVSYAPLRRWAARTGADPGAYDEQGPVFIHARQCAGPVADGVPFGNAHRTVRRYSAQGRILGGELVRTPGDAAFREAFHNALDDPSVAFVHVRAVEYGCFLYEVGRP
ncbi:DUF1203 domain-containing protein [Streptomyces adustus]|uniref:DUF1203 domain-containing protein n=1 Tax=Streptomyces adustus TaxID=1609272 RepID=A0A5N8VRT7_9ACTN|nr:DUF1203 domain-containing protein [Streptomyces adustus]MPY36585.1 DUF1203 domain-containing protein [Streptomyces adustus]